MMEILPVKQLLIPVLDMEQVINESSDENFIHANTIAVNLQDLRNDCIIPSFAKDNETTISHVEFIETIGEVTHNVFKHETILYPAIKCSHPISGRIPEAMGKPAKDLKDFEKTLYYERMAFIIEVPSIVSDIYGNEISLTIGGVRSYHLENLYSKKAEEHFKVFIGFKNKVCTNLCISTDGFLAELKVRTLSEMAQKVWELFCSFRYEEKFNEYSLLGNYSLTEHQFAQIIGRMRLYQYLPMLERKEIEAVPINDSQISSIARDYYCNNSFCRDAYGDINLWRVYNLFTSANKSSYIDTFLDRGAGCLQFTNMLHNALEKGEECWYLK